MKYSSVFLLLAAAMLAPISGLAADELYHPDGRGNFSRYSARAAAVSKGAAATGNGINYHNGPVMRGQVNVYYIWYGTHNATTKPILETLANYVGGSPYFNINTTYGDTVGNVANIVRLIATTTDNYSLGKSLTDANVQTIVSSAIASGKLGPADPNGVYFVLTAPDVKETSGFVTQYCGWHTRATISGLDIKYSFVGDPSTQGLTSCAVQTVSPNNNPGADGMASVLVHELEETVSDPDLNAWYDTNGNENADKCAWTFGTTYRTPNGSAANMESGRLGLPDPTKLGERRRRVVRTILLLLIPHLCERYLGFRQRNDYAIAFGTLDRNIERLVADGDGQRKWLHHRIQLHR